MIRLWPVLLAIAVGACVPTKKELPISLNLSPIGTKFLDEISVSDKKIPLPGGEWTVIGTQITKDQNAKFHAALMLIRTEENSVVSAVEIITNVGAKSSAAGEEDGDGWPTRRACTRDELHFLDVKENTRLGAQDSWWVNHRRMHRFGVGNSEHWMEARKFLVKHKISAPLDMVAVSFRFADKVDYMTAYYFFNPESEGLLTNKDIYWSVRNWETSDWHPDRIDVDPAKRRYLNRLIDWGKKWYPKIKKAFETK